ncbi:MAG TPA: sugar ABC transporter substrate-binding protein, partial [Pseudomonas sp.]|nr:sugar ABC transporter substrate-binding protein [Pseudomonas sp.]
GPERRVVDLGAKSGGGDRSEGVEVYLNQLIPCTKSMGIGASYTINR